VARGEGVGRWTAGATGAGLTAGTGLGSGVVAGGATSESLLMEALSFAILAFLSVLLRFGLAAAGCCSLAIRTRPVCVESRNVCAEDTSSLALAGSPLTLLAVSQQPLISRPEREPEIHDRSATCARGMRGTNHASDRAV